MKLARKFRDPRLLCKSSGLEGYVLLVISQFNQEKQGTRFLHRVSLSSPPRGRWAGLVHAMARWHGLTHSEADASLP